MKGGQTPGGRSEHGQRRKAAVGTSAGHEAHPGMMILALAMRHSVERPATGMEGGTKNPMERFCQPPSDTALFYIVNNEIQKRKAMRNLSEKCVSP